MIKPIYTLRNEDYDLTIKIGLATATSRKPIVSEIYAGDTYDYQRLFNTLAEALQDAISTLGMTASA